MDLKIDLTKYSNKMIRIISAYGFDSFKSLALSLFPSFKYGSQTPAITISATTAVVAQVLGFSPLIVAVMLVAVVVETYTGITASRKKGEHFESWKFSRCIFKLGVWVALFFIMHSFALEMGNFDGIPYRVAEWVFNAFHILLMVYFCIENATSILENLAVIDGKPKTEYIEAMLSLWKVLVENLKNIKTK